jgi:RNA polymerase sigma-70 factor (ECF subfamily)
MQPLSGRKAKPGLRVVSGAAGQLTDTQLLDAFDRGSREAAAEIYDRLVRVVDSTLHRVLGARGPDHDDLIQSAFEEIVSTLRRHRFARACSLTSWAGAISARVALRAIRRRRRERSVIDRGERVSGIYDNCADHIDVERQLSTQRELERLQSILAVMQPGRAEAVVLYHVLGHDLATMAAMQGISVAAAQSRLVRGRRELQQYMAAGERPTRAAGGSA